MNSCVSEAETSKVHNKGNFKCGCLLHSYLSIKQLFNDTTNNIFCMNFNTSFTQFLCISTNIFQCGK